MSKQHTLEMEPFQGNSRPKASKWEKIFRELCQATSNQEEADGLADSNVTNAIDLRVLKNYIKTERSFKVTLPFCTCRNL